MSKLSNSILKEIKKEGKKPLPKWVFVFKNSALWFAVIFSIIFLGIFLGTFIANLISANWQMAKRWPDENIGFLKDTIANAWGIGIIVALLCGIIFFRLTKKGYKYGLLYLTSIVLATSVVTGSTLIFTPIPQYMCAFKEKHLPPTINIHRFHNPEKGRIMGEIIAKNEETIYLQSHDGTEWTLWIFDTYSLEESDTIVAFGEIIDTGIFAAIDLHPVPPHYFVQE